MDNTSSYGECLRALRVAAGVDQQDLAARLGVTSSYLSQVEQGRKPLSDEGFAKARQALEELVDERLKTWLEVKAGVP